MEVSWKVAPLCGPKSGLLSLFPVLFHDGRSYEEAYTAKTDGEKEGG